MANMRRIEVNLVAQTRVLEQGPGVSSTFLAQNRNQTFAVACKLM
jgi:hypothetical protein